MVSESLTAFEALRPPTDPLLLDSLLGLVNGISIFAKNGFGTTTCSWSTTPVSRQCQW
jgi:hypothetical protein